MVKKNEVVVKKTNTNNSEVSEKKVDSVLIENFVSLQKVMTNLAVKFDNLSGQISKLLELFEISAKTLAEKDYSIGEEKVDKKLVEKLDNVLEQNKIIARGVALLHEKNLEEKSYPEQFQITQRTQSQIQQISQPAKRINEPQNEFTKNPRFQSSMEV
jgi:hypothetical protein